MTIANRAYNDKRVYSQTTTDDKKKQDGADLVYGWFDCVFVDSGDTFPSG